MVRISSFVLFAALLVSSPELSFAEAAPALNPRLPKQTLKPRYQHNFPKHIKNRQFNNGTTPTPAPQPQPESTPKETLAPETTHAPTTPADPNIISGLLGGIPQVVSSDLGVNVHPGGGVTVAPFSHTILNIPGPNDGQTSSQGPITQPNQQSSPGNGQTQLTSRSADANPNPVGVLLSDGGSLLSGVGSILFPEPSSTQQATGSSQPSQPTQQSQPAPEQSTAPANAGTNSATPTEGPIPAIVGGVTSDLGAVTSAIAPIVTPIESVASQLLSSALAPVDTALSSIIPTIASSPLAPVQTILTNTDQPTIPVSSPTDAATQPVSVPTDTASQPASVPTSNPVTVPSPTDTPVPVSTSPAPDTTASAQPETSQPTAPITHTVVPILSTSAASQPPSSAISQAPSASPETETAHSESATAPPQTQTPSAASSQQPTTAEQPATTERPASTAVPTVATPTAVAATSILPTGSDTLSSLFVPTGLVTESSTYVAPTSTAAFSSNGIPSSMPHVITPPDTNGVLPSQPPNTTLIQIGFEYALNYPFVLQHSSTVYQIFDILPWGLAFGLGIPNTNITMQSLQPYDTTRTLGFITTVALAYIPSVSVNNLTISVPNRGSLLYKNDNDTRHALMSVIDPNFPVLAGSGMISGDGTTSGKPATTSTIVDQGNPLDANAANGSPVNGTAVGIGVGVCAGAAVYGAAMFFIAKRYKQRKSRHSRSSSMIDTASEVNSTHGQMAGANTALMADGTDGSYGTRGGSRNSHGSGHSSQRGRGEISAPVMAENSLGWN